MPPKKLENTPDETLAGLLNLDTDGPLWTNDELRAVLKHQLAAPVEFDLNDLGRAPSCCTESLAHLQGSSQATFADLFRHPHPPIDLLESTKEFAKRSRRHPETPLPDEIATILYLLSIVVARLRLGRCITKLDDDGLRHALTWALDQTWLDPETREILQEGLQALPRKESD